MSDELATVLRLVSEGKLSAEEAAPIIAALNRPRAPQPSQTPEPPEHPFAGAASAKGSGRNRRIRIQVNERGGKVVDVRIPLAFAAMAARMIPGIPERYADLIKEAVESDTTGPIVDVSEDEDGDSVLISIE
jgi:SHOCT-like protein